MQALERALVLDRLAYCEEIRTEVEQILLEKLGWQRQRVENSLNLYLEEAIRAPVHGLIHGVCRDPKDDMILECALNANATAIITGDKDLLVLQRYRHLRVLTARQYVELPI